MADIFISYARSTEATARRVDALLTAEGYQVWRDDRLPAHRTYGEVIEERLRQSGAVLVLWSADAVQSQWVRAEADLARQAGTLVQARLDATTPPMPFNQIQCPDLASWTGEADAAAWQIVLASLAIVAGRDHAAPHAPPTTPVLAVLAFDNLSADPDLAYFSDGVSEEILQTVARTSSLTVVGRSSSFQFRGAGKSTRRIADQLNCTHLLDGSVRRSGERVRITAQLVECAGETTLWSQRFDRDLSDVFALQDEIAEAVAEALKVTFAPSAATMPIDAAAFDLYLRARALAIDVKIGASIELLEQAVAIAPDFAAAWGLLCRVRAAQARHGPRPRPYPVLKAAVIAAAETALRLDPDCAPAFAGLSALQPMGRYAERETLLNRAVAAAPNDADAVMYLGAFYNHVGFIDQALGLLERAYALDPLYPLCANVYGAVLWAAGRFDEAHTLTDAWRARAPELIIFTIGALNSAAAQGDWQRFDSLAAAGLAAGGGEDKTLRNSLRFGEARRRNDPEFRQGLVLRLNSELEKHGTVHLADLVTASMFGLKEEAFEVIEAASFEFMFDEAGADPSGRYNPGMIFVDSFFGVLMRDIRFVGLCAKLGLCDFWVATDRWPDCAEALAPLYDFKAEARRLARRRPQAAS